MDIKGAVAKWGRVQRARLTCGVIRVLLWGVAVAVALWPSMQLSHAPWLLDFSQNWLPDLRKLSTTVNAAGHYRDFFFVSIVVAIIGTCNLADNLASTLRQKEHFGHLSIIAFLILWVIFLGTIFYALPEFVAIAQAHSLNQDALNHDSDIMRNTLLAGFAAEIVIALRERPAQLPRENGRTA
jgi:hypothetical protein